MRQGPISYEAFSNRLHLRPFGSQDVTALSEMIALSLDRWNPWLIHPVRSDEVVTYAFSQIHRCQSGVIAGDEFRYGVWNGGNLVGMVALNNVSRGSTQCGLIGWSIGTPFVGNGFATEAVQALLCLAFRPQALGLHRVQANIMPANLASLAVANRTGFRREGTALRSVNIDGRWQDQNIFAVLADEFHDDGLVLTSEVEP